MEGGLRGGRTSRDGQISRTDAPRGRALAASDGRPAVGAAEPGGLTPWMRASASVLTVTGQGFDIHNDSGV